MSDSRLDPLELLQRQPGDGEMENVVAGSRSYTESFKRTFGADPQSSQGAERDRAIELARGMLKSSSNGDVAIVCRQFLRALGLPA